MQNYLNTLKNTACKNCMDFAWDSYKVMIFFFSPGPAEPLKGNNVGCPFGVKEA